MSGAKGETLPWLHPALAQGQILFRLREYCASNSVSFVDKAFPPTRKSITGGDVQDRPRLAAIKWKRVQDIYPGCALTDEINATQLRQGSLGNAYFLSALSVVAQKPSRLRRLLPSADSPSSGVLAVWLFSEGRWQEVVIDDYFPVMAARGKATPAFTHSGPNFWAMAIEKAYAKLRGGYLSCQSGNAREAMQCLTGVNGQEIRLSEVLADEDWLTVLRAYKKEQLVMCAFPPDEFAGGVVTISEVVEVSDKAAGSFRLVRLASPFVQIDFPTRATSLPLLAATVGGGKGWVLFDELIAERACVLLVDLSLSCFNSLKLTKDLPPFQALRVVSPGPGSAVVSVVRHQAEHEPAFIRVTLARVRERRHLQVVAAELSDKKCTEIAFEARRAEYVLLVEKSDSSHDATVTCSGQNCFEMTVSPVPAAEIEQLIWEDYAQQLVAKAPPTKVFPVEYNGGSLSLLLFSESIDKAGLHLLVRKSTSPELSVCEQWLVSSISGLEVLQAEANPDLVEVFATAGGVGVTVLKCSLKGGLGTFCYQVIGREALEGGITRDRSVLDLLRLLAVTPKPPLPPSS